MSIDTWFFILSAKGSRTQPCSWPRICLCILDQQLYRVAHHGTIHIGFPISTCDSVECTFSWFSSQHLVVSVAGSGLHLVLSKVFAGVEKMLPHNVMCSGCLPRNSYVRSSYPTKWHVCLTYKRSWTLSSRSRTCKLWIDCLIKHVLIMLKYLRRAEYERDWHLPILILGVVQSCHYLFRFLIGFSPSMGAMVVILDLSILGVVQSYEYLFYLNPGTIKHMVRHQNYLLMYYG